MLILPLLLLNGWYQESSAFIGDITIKNIFLIWLFHSSKWSMEINLCWWSGEHAAVGRRAGPGLESSELCTCLGRAHRASPSHGEPRNPDPRGAKMRRSQQRECKTQSGCVRPHCSHPAQCWCLWGGLGHRDLCAVLHVAVPGGGTAQGCLNSWCCALQSWQESILLIQHILIYRYVDAINCQVQNNPWQVMYMCVCALLSSTLCERGTWYTNNTVPRSGL